MIRVCLAHSCHVPSSPHKQTHLERRNYNILLLLILIFVHQLGAARVSRSGKNLIPGPNGDFCLLHLV